MAYTTKPCPGCGEVQRDRPADKVCYNCADKLKRVAEIEAECVQLRAKVGDTLTIETNARWLAMPSKAYWSVGQADLEDTPEYQAFRKATAEMLTALTAPLNRGREPKTWGHDTLPYTGGGSGISNSDKMGVIEASDMAASMGIRWYQSIGPLVRSYYAVGLDHGRDLIKQLAAGEMTAGQVNDHVDEMHSRRRVR